MLEQRIRDAAVWMSFPQLRGQLHNAKRAGLESLLDYQRLAMIVAAVRLTNAIEGDVIEFGTFRGGTAGVILQNLAPQKILHICDSFTGMPPVAAEDNYHQEGDFAKTGHAQVIRGLAELGTHFKAHVGFFSETIPEMEKKGPDTIAFAHIDADLYQSVLDALEFCYPRMVRGGVMILDDYAAPSCLGAKQAADEFFSGKSEHIVPLSQPSHGCLVGGGDLFATLTNVAGQPLSSGIVNARVFKR